MSWYMDDEAIDGQCMVMRRWTGEVVRGCQGMRQLWYGDASRLFALSFFTVHFPCVGRALVVFCAQLDCALQCQMRRTIIRV